MIDFDVRHFGTCPDSESKNLFFENPDKYPVIVSGYCRDPRTTTESGQGRFGEEDQLHPDRPCAGRNGFGNY